MDRAECLRQAQEIVCKDREETYGKPEDNFGVVAGFWARYLECPVDAVDVANMMVLLKVARAASGDHKDDNYIDIAGYAACACELGSRAAVKKGQEGW